jgi:hypothetical protein
MKVPPLRSGQFTRNEPILIVCRWAQLFMESQGPEFVEPNVGEVLEFFIGVGVDRILDLPSSGRGAFFHVCAMRHSRPSIEANKLRKL